MAIFNIILPWLQVAIAILLIGAVLLQRSQEGLGEAFGGQGGVIFRTKRGLEKTLFIGTIILAILFIAINTLALFTV